MASAGNDNSTYKHSKQRPGPKFHNESPLENISSSIRAISFNINDDLLYGITSRPYEK